MSEPAGVGRILGGRYRLDQLLGQGGMSPVYKATDPNLRRTVAVKLIHPHLTVDPQFVRRFEIEAAAVAQLHHPNIIQVYDFERDGDTYYMVLQFVPGESLDKRLKRLAGEYRRACPQTRRPKSLATSRTPWITLTGRG
jgi:eukaryotic-like serine/threonine-protein kinase